MPDDVKNSFLEYLAESEADQWSAYCKYREYYDGDHDTLLNKRLREFLQVKDNQEFNANYIPIVVDALAERLCVIGFSAGEATVSVPKADGQGSESITQGALFWRWWTNNRMDGTQGIVHTATVRDGDTYAIVEWDNDKQAPTFSHELAYDGTSGVQVHYSTERRGQIAYATKRWRIEADDPEQAGYVRRMNKYFPNRVEKYISNQLESEGNWQSWRGVKGTDPWPIWWTRDNTEQGEPLGVPVVHFKNRDQGYDYGKSEIKDVIPQQNALNKSIIDLLAAADTSGFRIYTMIGDDPSGLKVGPGAWIYSTRPATGENSASISHIPGEDLSKLIALCDSFVVRIAQISRTPLSYFQMTGQVARAETQKQDEAGLVSKALALHTGLGNSWEDLMIIARRLHNTFGPGGLDENQAIETQWRSPETRNEKELSETLLNDQKLGVPQEVLWAKRGYSPQEIETMKQTNEFQAREAQRQAAVTSIASMQQKGQAAG